jgi:hypothetical protein
MNHHAHAVRTRSQVWRLSLVTGIVALAATALLGVAGGAGAAPTSLAAVGPTDGEHGFPTWYQDDMGTRLVPCFADEIACHVEVPDPALDMAFPGNFPDVFNYWAAEPTDWVLTNAPAGLNIQPVAWEVGGGFANEAHAVVPDDQAVANAAQLRIRGLEAGQYTITHPFGSLTASPTRGQIRVHLGFECEVAPCNFAGALNGAVTRFLMPAGGPTADGLLSDGVNPVKVTGSPTGNNFVRIEGPGGFEAYTDDFVLFGQLFEPDGATAPPAPPGNVQSAKGDAQATITWNGISVGDATDGGAPVTGYRLVSDPAGVDATVTADHRSFTATGLTNGTTYTFSVAGVNSAGAGTAAVSPPVTPLTVPSVPQVVTAAEGPQLATISWSPPASDGGAPVTDYEVVRQPGSVVQVMSAASGTSLQSTGLTNGVTYSFTVRARNSEGVGPASPAVTVTPGPPAMPAGLQAVGGLSVATLSWTNPPQPDLAGIEIRVREGAVAPANPQQGTLVFRGRASTRRITGLRHGTTYSFSVFAFDQAGNYSGPRSVRLDGTRSTLLRSAGRIISGSSVTVTGVLTNARTGLPAAGQPVEVWRRQRGSGTAGWRRIATVTSSASGAASLANRTPWNADYQLRYAGNATNMGTASPVVGVDVAPRVTATLSRTSSLRNQTTTVTGSVAPNLAGRRVILQRRVNGVWGNVASSTLSATSTYGFSVRPTTTGTYDYRVLVPAAPPYAAGVSPTRRLTVS